MNMIPQITTNRLYKQVVDYILFFHIDYPCCCPHTALKDEARAMYNTITLQIFDTHRVQKWIARKDPAAAAKVPFEKMHLCA